ncbi:MAG: hypothetical protein HZB43_07370 [candidate division Zixibacteria bacterium]|nr:hypothetical protein [candidate division Zixibacteria bacterium]
MDAGVLQASNSVVVESKTVAAGATGVLIRVRITNDVTLGFVEFPFEIRSVSGGAFVSSIRLNLSERLSAVGWSSMVGQGLATPELTSCKNSQPGGYATVSWSGFNTYHDIVASPEGIRIMGWKLYPGEQYLQPGADANGSIAISVNVLDHGGVFEIDTTCVDPATHLDFGDSAGMQMIIPSFTKGVITVRARSVTNLADSGPGSLRSAIDSANARSGIDTITFGVSGTIQVLTPLPPLSEPGSGTYISGFTAPGASAPYTPSVILDGSLCPPGPGLDLRNVHQIVEGLVIRNFHGAGVALPVGLSYYNTITSNVIYGNSGLAIDLWEDGVTPNDPGDTDAGPNALLNYPVFDSAIQTGIDSFAVYGTAPPFSRVELFLACEAGNPQFQLESVKHGPAYRLLGWSLVSAGGEFMFHPILEPPWSAVTATATDTLGNTSELARNKLLVPDPLRVTAYSEPLPPGLRGLSLPLITPPIQISVYGPPDSVGHIDSIGPNFNTFGLRATYDSLTDLNTGGLPDSRVHIASPDTGEYLVKYSLIGPPGEYLTGIGIDGHQEAQKNIAFGIPGQIDSLTFLLSPPIRGELTGDGLIDVFDVIAAIDIVFGGKPMPDPPEKVDVNCDGLADVYDVIGLIDYAFGGGTQPCQ